MQKFILTPEQTLEALTNYLNDTGQIGEITGTAMYFQNDEGNLELTIFEFGEILAQ